MTLAIGRLSDAVTGAPLGTVFAVTDRFALTAFHCVGDRMNKKITVRRLRCTWEQSVSDATVHSGDPLNDVALIRLKRKLPAGLYPVPVVAEAPVHAPFRAPGAPHDIQGVSLFAASGQVTWSSKRLEDGAHVIQLACSEADKLSMHGLSGAPVLLGSPPRAAGVIRWNEPRRDNPELAAGSTLFAAPFTAIIAKWPDLIPPAVDEAETRALLERLTRPIGSRTDVAIRDDISRLLMVSGLDLNEHDISASEELGHHSKGSLYVTCSSTVIQARTDVCDAARAAAEHDLEETLALYARRSGRRHIGLMTDGVTWHLYHRADGRLHHVETATFSPKKSSKKDADLIAWLESVLATRQQIEPTPDEINRKLGAASPAYALDSAELKEIYAQCRDLPVVRLKRDMWANLLTTASGTRFTDDDTLFVDHSLLVAMAEVIGHAVVGFPIESPEVDAKAIMSGKFFAQSQVEGVVESDFFDWIVHVPAGEQFIKDLARRLTRFAWGQVEHDVLKGLYESIIPEHIRHRLGEYYTPDWLAEEIVASCVQDPLSERVLDASCGSGTFLFHAVRTYIAAAKTAGKSDIDIISEVTEHVFGFDIHPVAVTLARVTYLLAIGMERLRTVGRPAFAVPIYLADALQWGRESPMWRDDLRIPTTLDHETLVHDPEYRKTLDPSDLLQFPESLVSNAGKFDQLVTEFADKATSRERGSPAPSLVGTFRRFAVAQEDQPILQQTFTVMCRLHDENRDHIWGYYVRNRARPLWLARPNNRVDVLVGNPPWLAYRYMTEPQKTVFRSMSVERKLWVGRNVATNQDLSALFVARCVERYLRTGGRFGYVMPLGTLDRSQYAGFREGQFSVKAETVNVAFERPWDLQQVRPNFFPQSVGVIFGKRQSHDKASVPLRQSPTCWIGNFATRTATRAEALENTVRRARESTLDATTAHRSLYASRFYQGANLVPRFLFVVDENDNGPLGTGGGQQSVSSRRSPFEKTPWKRLPSLHGTVERIFIRPLYLGESILPFRTLEPMRTVVPWDGIRLLDSNNQDIEHYPGLANWWRQAENVWTQNRSSERLSLTAQLDYRSKLTQQFYTPGHRVVYTKSGLYLAASIVSTPQAVIDHKLYWGSVTDLDEARFLVSILNSTTLTNLVRPLQGRGMHNPRDFDKYVFKLPIPAFQPSETTHRQLVSLSERAERVAAGVTLTAARFETQRRRVREALVQDGVAAEIDAIVATLLSS
ncbi:N-6 DNA methylase [Streptomyces fulvoviolaceus]|uniref:N-6 DNA methylase n=1 Tax=Streptomyces fulvoviolaceus TaxID=285535 RepID=UPI000B2A89DB|nr:N-6 DNA methylase [Streptomyces fulvoviolaceus]